MAGNPKLKIVRLSLADQVATKIKEAILSGELLPGSRLVETALAEETGASRGTIRAALSELQRDRLVDCARYSAWSVALLDAQRLQEIYTLRAVLESGAARLLAGCITAEGVAAIREAEAALARAEGGADAAERLSSDLAFHGKIVALCGNGLLIEAYSRIADQVRWVYAVSERAEPARIELDAWHAPLADAICCGDGEAAGRIAFELCMRSLEGDLRADAGKSPA